MAATAPRVTLGPDSWGDFYDFLDPGRQEKSERDRDAVAEAKCLEIRRKLVVFFSARGCPEAEDLSIETLLRVAARCREVDVTGFGDRAGYFYGVARNVLHEWQRRETTDAEHREAFRSEWIRLPQTDAASWDEPDTVRRHLARCLAALTERSRRLILSYYAEDRSAKIEHHRAMAAEFGRSVNSLRIEVHRIRKSVRECVNERLREEPGVARAARAGPGGS
jgi:RNA polymerase sigma factor (sigma-70 family)